MRSCSESSERCPSGRAGRRIVRVALLVGREWRGRGYASEAARAVVDWLWRNGASDVVAHVHTRDVAAQVVAARAGLEPTDDRIGDEQIWRPFHPRGRRDVLSPG